MKTKYFKLTIFAITATVILFFSSCSNKVQFLSSAIVPAARGTVQVKKDFNQNYVIKINIYDLAGSERLTPPKNTYVVWLETSDNMMKNIGQINTTNSLDAEFETVTAFNPSKIMISAENEANVSYPSYSDIVLKTGYLK